LADAQMDAQCRRRHHPSAEAWSGDRMATIEKREQSHWAVLLGSLGRFFRGLLFEPAADIYATV
jgi:hypothetical protein